MAYGARIPIGLWIPYFETLDASWFWWVQCSVQSVKQITPIMIQFDIDRNIMMHKIIWKSWDIIPSLLNIQQVVNKRLRIRAYASLMTYKITQCMACYFSCCDYFLFASFLCYCYNHCIYSAHSLFRGHHYPNTKDSHSPPFKAGYGCFSWVWNLSEVLYSKLLYCLEDRVISTAIYRESVVSCTRIWNKNLNLKAKWRKVFYV